MVWWLWSGQYGPTHSAAEKPDSAISAQVLSTLSEHGAQACCMWSQADGFFHFSDNWTRVTQIEAAEAMNAGLLEFLHEDGCEEMVLAIKDMCSPDPHDQADYYEVECRVYTEDDEPLWLQVTMIPMHAGGKLQATVMVRDITQMKVMEEVAMIAKRESEVANYGRASFLSNMSHELRTPLNAILGFAQMLQMNADAAPNGMKDYLKHINDSGEELLTKINDLIEISNINSGCTRLNEGPLNVSDLIEAAIEMHSHRAFQRDIKIRYQNARPKMVIQADRAKLVHALNHLLANAVKHSPDGGIIMIHCEASARSGLNISVTDHGSGMSKDHLTNLHTSLNSKHSYFSTDIDNIGIGLSIAKEMIELHGGKLAIESMDGEGTTAHLRMPAGRIISLSARVKLKNSTMRVSESA